MEITEKILVSKSLVEPFSEISGDKNPIHLDENYAKNTHFRHTIAPGILLVSFFSKIIANTYPGIGSIYLSQESKFISPCFVGDEIIVKVSKISQDKNKYELATQILSLDGRIIIDGKAKVLKK